jgi:CheY-like chemotaxis protein/HPt (histidine-containing phosphotransfer) domain-containing protein
MGCARILLVEDNLINQRVVLGLLGKLGLHAKLAANGIEAIQRLETEEFDLVLMDVQMPKMDGYEATARIRDPQSRVLKHDVPIVALTANAMVGDRQKCMHAGMSDFLTKPIEFGAFAAMLEKWLQQKSPGRPPAAAGGQMEQGATAPGGRTPAFNRKALMSRVMNDEELARSVVEGFLEDLPANLAQLKRCLETGDAHGAAQAAHKIKGASGSAGADALCALAASMEQAAKTGDTTALAASAAELDGQFETFQRAVKAEMPVGD